MCLPHLLVYSSVVWRLSCVFSCPCLESNNFSKKFWLILLEQGIWKVLGARCFQALSVYRTGKHMFINTCSYVHLYIFLYLAICISVKILEVRRMPLTAIHNCRPNSSFPLLICSSFIWEPKIGMSLSIIYTHLPKYIYNTLTNLLTHTSVERKFTG